MAQRSKGSGQNGLIAQIESIIAQLFKPSKKRRVLSRARRARTRAFCTAFAAKVRGGSTRAILALSVAVLLVLAVPAGIIFALSNGNRPASAVENADEPEMLTLDIGAKAKSAGFADEETALITPSPTPEPHPTNTVFKRGMSAPVVIEIQERLMELGYMDQDEPTEYFGPITKLAVEYFQRKHSKSHGLVIDGCVGKDTYELLMSSEATYYSVSEGDSGQDVNELQIRLRELGYINKATEYFGTETTAAVKKFQERNGLSADGTVGELTREALYSEDAKANYYERGEVREEIKTYQKRLKELGYLTGEADGKYGSSTEQAVKRFQERSALIADGYLGPETIKYLMRKDAQANALMIGMSGRDVETVQERLKELGYLKKVTGYFGSDTEQAVRDFQATNKLSVDGKVGKQTMNTLTSSKAKKYSGTSGGSSSGSSSSGSSGSSGGSSSSGGSTTVAKGASVDKFIEVAKSKLGSKYVRGAKGPNSFDCSGFVYWCLNQAGVKQGYMTSASWQKTTKYQRISSMNSLKRGDVISFKGHVGIYLGNGQMIDASSSEGKIRICSNIQSNSYWKKNFVRGYRIF